MTTVKYIHKKKRLNNLFKVEYIHVDTYDSFQISIKFRNENPIITKGFGDRA